MNIPTLQAQYGTSFGFLQKNLEGFDIQNSSLTPAAGGNSATWLLSHIVATRQTPVLFSGGQPIWNQERIQRWGRSPAPLEVSESTDWNQLLTDLNKSQEHLMVCLENMNASDLEKPKFRIIGISHRNQTHTVIAFIARDGDKTLSLEGL